MKYILIPLFRIWMLIWLFSTFGLIQQIIRVVLFIWYFSDKTYQTYFVEPYKGKVLDLFDGHYYKTYKDFIFNKKSYEEKK